MDQYRDKFQRLLRELFQFDCADLDFGIYRIMNYKRDVIEKFISTDLPKAIADELDRGALGAQSQAAAQLAETAQQIAQTLGKDALDADGNLAEAYRGTPVGKKYLDLRRKAAGGRGREALETTIFNHLYAFFSRYYQDGDFISKRRYSKRQKYAIPYNGEEVHLHWANHDQYYVKTAEHFHDYTFTSRGVTVHFKLTAANVEQNNVKGDKRFFLPRVKEVEWNEKAGELVVPFEFRPLTDREQAAYGTKSQQDKIIAEAADAIPKRLKKADKPLVAITAERRKNSDGKPVTFLEHHLRQYTRKNTSDFFIHKDLKGFLSRELDFYLKNDVLNLDEMEAAGEDRAEGWFQVLRVIKAVGGRIIDFLDQIESFQKMLWEKRKFVTETQYCITVGTIDESFYPDIAACDAQWAEWKELFHIDEEQSDLFTSGKSQIDRRGAFLRSHPTLILDTKHFEDGLVDRLLASFDDLDSMTDGLLIHGENFQAIALLMAKYRKQVQCIYIDPPYNTGNDGFLYKDSYQHSSWLSMMRDRASLARALMNDKGSFYCQIDYWETHRLRELLDTLFVFQREIIWDIQVLSGFKTIAPNWIRGHETLYFYTASDDYIFKKLRQPHSKEYEEMFNRKDGDGRKFMVAHGTTRYWDEVKDKGKPFGDVWSDIMSFQQQPTAAERIGFATQKPEKLLERIILSCTEEGDYVLDYFGGSGTTAACAQKLGRKYLLCEMGDHFDLVVVPRMKRTLYGDVTSVSRTCGYKGGGIFKYICCESYEDALNNIAFDDAAGQGTLEFDDYLLKYMLKWETRKSATLLNVEQLTKPFSYKLTVAQGDETTDKVVDLPETFNYLLGLHVSTRKVYWNDECGKMNDEGTQGKYLVYRGRIDHRQVVVIWRETEGWQRKDLERDKKFVAEQKLAEGADEVFVNGDSFIPGAKALEPVFKARMFSGMMNGE